MFYDTQKLEVIKSLLSELGAQNIHVTKNSNNWVSLNFDFLIDVQQVCLGLTFENRANWTTPPIFTVLTRDRKSVV